jgi:hypothetical protein
MPDRTNAEKTEQLREEERSHQHMQNYQGISTKVNKLCIG